MRAGRVLYHINCRNFIYQSRARSSPRLVLQTHAHEYVRFSQVLDLMPSVGVVTAITITIIKVDGLGARHRHRPRSQLSHLRGEIRILRVHPKERMLKRVQIYRCQLHWQ